MLRNNVSKLKTLFPLWFVHLKDRDGATMAYALYIFKEKNPIIHFMFCYKIKATV